MLQTAHIFCASFHLQMFKIPPTSHLSISYVMFTCSPTNCPRHPPSTHLSKSFVCKEAIDMVLQHVHIFSSHSQIPKWPHLLLAPPNSKVTTSFVCTSTNFWNCCFPYILYASNIYIISSQHHCCIFCMSPPNSNQSTSFDHMPKLQIVHIIWWVTSKKCERWTLIFFLILHFEFSDQPSPSNLHLSITTPTTLPLSAPTCSHLLL